MKIQFLGTAAYEGVPAMFCNCETCRASMEKGGKNMRSRSQALINDDLLLDFPADTVWHFQRFHLDWEKIRDCLITHSHSDHLYPMDLEMLAPGYTHEHSPIHFHAGESGYRMIKEVMDRPHIAESMKRMMAVSLVEPGKRFTVGENGKYSVLPLWANHAQDTSPVIYSITCEGKRILYAHDSGVFCKETWEKLKEEGRFDLVSLDCTGGGVKGWREGHMCLDTNLEVFEQMQAMNLIDEKTVRVINHFSHNGARTYEEMCADADPYGIVVSYDGLELEF